MDKKDLNINKIWVSKRILKPITYGYQRMATGVLYLIFDHWRAEIKLNSLTFFFFYILHKTLTNFYYMSTLNLCKYTAVLSNLYHASTSKS